MSTPPVTFRQDSKQVEASFAGAGAATYRFGGLPKACIHPLITRAGHRLTGFEMSDHIWHRGIWFTIKFVNGTNFWEEQAPFGVQSDRPPHCELIDGALRIAHNVEWTSEATGKVIDEKRSITLREGVIDWSCELRAAQDLTLDRTPYTTWGGYGGLAYRANRELHDATFLLPNGDSAFALTGQPHDWTVMQAKMDGGADQMVSIGFIDHPSNPRSPSPWYNKTGNGFNYMNPAFLFHEPMTLGRGESLRFSYRMLYRDGMWSAAEFAALAAEFRGMKTS